MDPLTFFSSLTHPIKSHFRLRDGCRALTKVNLMSSDNAHYYFVNRQPFKRHVWYWVYFLDSIIAKSDENISLFHALGECSKPTVVQQNTTTAQNEISLYARCFVRLMKSVVMTNVNFQKYMERALLGTQ